MFFVFCFVQFFRTFQADFIPHGSFSIQSLENFSYSLLPFSNLIHPEGPTTFTIVKQGDYCETSNIVRPNSSLGAIVNHGHCSIYIEAQNLAKVGYKYVIIAGYDANIWQSDETSLNIFIAAISVDIGTVVPRYTEEIIISVFPTHADRKIFDCHMRLQYLQSNKMFSNLYSIARSCISLSIIQIQSENRQFLDFSELQITTDLAKILWDNNLFDEANLLLRWVSSSLMFNPQLFIRHQEISSFGSITQEIISLLFTLGEWNVAADLLANQINYFCSSSSTKSLEICSQQCNFLFLFSIGTLLKKFSSTSQSNDGTTENGWDISGSEDFPHQFGEGRKSSSPLFFCYSHYENLINNQTVSIDNLNSQIIKDITIFLHHPSLWLAASELIYVSKKYGVLNIMSSILQPKVETVTEVEKSTESSTTQFSNFLMAQSGCKISNQTETLLSNQFFTIVNSSPKLRVEFVPQISLSQLKKKIQPGRSRGKHSGILVNAIRSHLQQDMIEIHTRLAVYWDEYGSFPASQRHTLRKLSLVLSQSSLTSQSCISPQNLYRMGCLFERLVVAIPMIFSFSEEFVHYRAQQVASLRIISKIVLSHSSQVGPVDPPTDLLNHHQVLALEKSITSTPPSMMIGYQYEFQDFGDKALPPATAVAPSSSEILHTRHMIEKSCLLAGSFALAPNRLSKLNQSIATIGFISRFFYEHSVGRLIHGVILHLDPKKFNIIVFCICCLQTEELDDSIQRSMKASPTISWVDLPGNSIESMSPFQCAAYMASNQDKQSHLLSRIQSFNLDILVYPEIGMDSLTINLATFRLAPVQVVFWGHPISQQLPSIDYFISSELFDTFNPKCQYPRLGYEKCPFGFTTSEQIIYLRGLTTVFAPLNTPPPTTQNPFRKYFSLLPQNSQNHAHLYILPHTIMKYSTGNGQLFFDLLNQIAFIRTLATLLLRDQNGILIIFYSSNQYLWYRKLQRSIGLHIKKLYCQVRLSDAESLFSFPENEDSFPRQKATHEVRLPACYHPSCGLCCDCEDSNNLEFAFKRIVLIPKVERELYLSMISFGSVILDPFPFGMGVTAIESFLLGTPVITLPSHQSTPALTYGMIRQMRLDHQNNSMVARTVNEYIEFALRIATTGKFRNEIIETLKSRANLLLNDFSTIRDWELFFLNVYRWGPDF